MISLLQPTLELSRLLNEAGKSEREIAADRKSAPWKAAIAHAMRTTTSASNHWLAYRMNMGEPDSVSYHLSVHRRRKDFQTFGT